LLADAPKRLKPGSPEFGQLFADMGNWLLELKEFATAEPILRDCLAVREEPAKTNQLQPWRVANVKSILGAALLGQKKYTDAEPLLLTGYNELKKDEKDLPPQGTYIPDALQRLVDFYQATGQKNKAEHYRKELNAAKAASKPPAKQ
jgi:hypothetical protein